MSAGDGSGAVSLEVNRDGVGFLTLDVPGKSVNVLSTPVMEELDDHLGEIESLVSTGRVLALVLRSGKEGGFVAGADVEEIAHLRDIEEATAKSREGQRIFRRLDRLNVPTMAAVSGTCLGGGTEAILACDFRLADGSGTRIGLPEVKLGILPGFGGTVRLPRLCGIRNALDLLLTGDPVSATKALRIGLVDRVAEEDDFRAATEAFVSDVLEGRVRRGGYRKSLPERLLEETGPGRRLLFALARRKTEERSKGRYPAPLRALEVVRETLELPLDEALRVEARALGELALTPESRNLTRIFLLTGEAKRALGPEVKDRRRPVRKLAVLGAGVMGGSIAELAAAHDLPVLLKDIDREPLETGLRHARELLEKAAAKGVFGRDEVDLRFAMIDGRLDYEGFGDVDLVVEAVVERMAVKRQVLREAEEVLPEEAVFATNTSSLRVSELAEAAARPGRVVGLHFFNPVHRMPLVEVVRTGTSDPDALATAMGFASDMGKNPVLVGDGPGFLVNRILAPYLNETGYLLEEGTGVNALDRALVDFGMPMGPCRLLDEVGLDIAHHVSGRMQEAFGDRMKPTDTVERLLEDGRLGRKNGLGFYLYRNGREKKVDPDLRSLLPRPASVPPDPDEIRRRCLYLMVNEAAYVLAEGIVEEAGMVDLAMVMGTGFPPFRGGLLRWADVEGLPRVVEGLRDFRERHGSRFMPAPLLVERAERGVTFTDPDFA